MGLPVAFGAAPHCKSVFDADDLKKSTRGLRRQLEHRFNNLRFIDSTDLIRHEVMNNLVPLIRDYLTANAVDFAYGEDCPGCFRILPRSLTPLGRFSQELSATGETYILDPIRLSEKSRTARAFFLIPKRAVMFAFDEMTALKPEEPSIHEAEHARLLRGFLSDTPSIFQGLMTVNGQGIISEEIITYILSISAIASDNKRSRFFARAAVRLTKNQLAQLRQSRDLVRRLNQRKRVQVKTLPKTSAPDSAGYGLFLGPHWGFAMARASTYATYKRTGPYGEIHFFLRGEFFRILVVGDNDLTILNDFNQRMAHRQTQRPLKSDYTDTLFWLEDHLNHRIQRFEYILNRLQRDVFPHPATKPEALRTAAEALWSEIKDWKDRI